MLRARLEPQVPQVQLELQAQLVPQVLQVLQVLQTRLVLQVLLEPLEQRGLQVLQAQRLQVRQE